MRIFVLFLAAAGVLPAATLTISPSIIYDCVGIHGHATVSWNGALGAVRIAVGPEMAQMTGLMEARSGSVETGEWVGEGLQFFLVGADGAVQASATARVRCGGASSPVPPGDSFYPLAVGDTWVYRVDSRVVTSDYVTQTVSGLEEIGGRTYFVITTYAGDRRTTAMLVRQDADGRILRFTGSEEAPAEEVWLDPASAAQTGYVGPLGSFGDAVMQTMRQGLIQTMLTFVRGIGLVHTRADLLTGSSGGFTDGLDLVEVRLAGGIHLEVPAPHLSLAAESTVLDVSGRKVTNCAVPCYFVACGFGPGTDPPGTYKPCAQVRVSASAEGDFFTQLELLNAAGDVVFEAPAAMAPAGETLRYVQVPLYSAPNVPLPAGVYRLMGRMTVGGEEAASEVLTVEIR